MTDELKAEREVFEKWAHEECIDIRRHHYYIDQYKNEVCTKAWEAWQARAQLDRTHTTGGDGNE